jgi:hypothetical protein
MIDIIYILQVVWDKKEFINFYLGKIDYSTCHLPIGSIIVSFTDLERTYDFP